MGCPVRFAPDACSTPLAKAANVTAAFGTADDDANDVYGDVSLLCACSALHGFRGDDCRELSVNSVLLLTGGTSVLSERGGVGVVLAGRR